MRKKLKKKPSRKGLKADATVANIREEGNTNRKTPPSTARFMSAAGE